MKSGYIKRQDVIDIISHSYAYESIRLAVIQELPVVDLDKILEELEKITKKYDEYARAEEQGLLLRLPLKIGDTVYSVTRDFISEYTICSIEKYNEGLFFNWRCEKGMYVNLKGFTEYAIGETVFLTQEQAEQKLKEMESQ